MAQFKIYGHRAFLEQSAAAISTAIHGASVGALGLPEEKRFHRFIPLEPWQFVSPPDRSDRYLIIEVMMFEGRPVATKKAFFAQLASNLKRECGVGPVDIEVTIIESPRHDWFIRGLPGDELTLDYRVDHESRTTS